MLAIETIESHNSQISKVMKYILLLTILVITGCNSDDDQEEKYIYSLSKKKIIEYIGTPEKIEFSKYNIDSLELTANSGTGCPLETNNYSKYKNLSTKNNLTDQEARLLKIYPYDIYKCRLSVIRAAGKLINHYEICFIKYHGPQDCYNWEYLGMLINGEWGRGF